MPFEPAESVGLPAAELEAWVAELRNREAATSRSRTASLRRQAAEDGSFVGTLVELHEAARTIVVDTLAGNGHRGRLRLVGRDVCVMRTERGPHVVLTMTSIRSVRPSDAAPSSTGEIRPTSRVTLHQVLAALAEERPRVTVTAIGSAEALRGQLESVGRDVITLRLDGRGGIAYLPLTSLAELSVAESG
jgi:hypothetical protein